MFTSIRNWVRGLIPRTFEAVTGLFDSVDPVFAFVIITSLMVATLTLLFPNLCTQLYEGARSRLNLNW